jgi:hypothetical protein
VAAVTVVPVHQVGGVEYQRLNESVTVNLGGAGTVRVVTRMTCLPGAAFGLRVTALTAGATVSLAGVFLRAKG